MSKKNMPRSLDYGDTENCTGDKDIYCPYADVYGCDGKREHDVEKTEREARKTRNNTP